MWEWDEAAVRKLLGSLTVERSRVLLMAKDGLPEGTWSKERWYGVEYRTEPLPATLAEEVRSGIRLDA